MLFIELRNDIKMLLKLNAKVDNQVLYIPMYTNINLCIYIDSNLCLTLRYLIIILNKFVEITLFYLICSIGVIY